MTAKAIILAAGLGSRMGSLSDICPKPLVPVCGKALIDYTLDRLDEAEIESAIVNLYHLRDQFKNHLANRHKSGKVIFSEEENLLETGGAVKQALPLLASRGFLVINSDIIWSDQGGLALLSALQDGFNPETMDFLLALIPLDAANGYDGLGDLTPTEGQSPSSASPLQIRMQTEGVTAPFVYGGVMMTHGDPYTRCPDHIFSNKILFREAAEKGRLFGLVYDGLYLHVGTPESLQQAEKYLDDTMSEISSPAGKL